MLALITGISCNIFIVGINQIADVNIDRVNKPYLPIPMGVLTIDQAKIIVIISLLLSLGLALFISSYLFLIILLACAIGWAYSMPPLHLKKHHLPAALAISLVRGILINAAAFMVFNYIVNKTTSLPPNVIILTGFIIVFSVVISWFKDLPDIKGDSLHNIQTLAIVYSARTTLIAGSLLVGCTYLVTIVLKYIDMSHSAVPTFQMRTLLYGHVLLFFLFALNSFAIDLTKQWSIEKFYKRFWWFFFAEYILYLVAYARPGE